MTPQPPARVLSRRAAEIVAAAGTVLEAEGSEAVTMRRLGEELGIRAPSLYKHFADKQAVETALIEQALLEVGEVVHRVVAEAAPGEVVAALLRSYREFCVAHPDLYRLATSGPIDRDALTP